MCDLVPAEPYPVLGHHAHDILKLGLRRDRVHLGRVDSRDLLRHHRGASPGQRPDSASLSRGAGGEHDGFVPDRKVHRAGDEALLAGFPVQPGRLVDHVR